MHHEIKTNNFIAVPTVLLDVNYLCSISNKDCHHLCPMTSGVKLYQTSLHKVVSEVLSKSFIRSLKLKQMPKWCNLTWRSMGYEEASKWNVCLSKMMEQYHTPYDPMFHEIIWFRACQHRTRNRRTCSKDQDRMWSEIYKYSTRWDCCPLLLCFLKFSQQHTKYSSRISSPHWQKGCHSAAKVNSIPCSSHSQQLYRQRKKWPLISPSLNL